MGLDAVLTNTGWLVPEIKSAALKGARPITAEQMVARRMWGVSQDLSPTVSYGMLLCDQCPSTRFRAIQIQILGKNTAGITADVAPSSVFGSGFQPKQANGTTNQAATLFTWGTTDINDVRNPGGGSPYGTISNASGSFSYPTTSEYTQGSAWSDWLFLDSLDRVDVVGGKALAFLRWYAPNNNTGLDNVVNIGGQMVTIPPGNSCPGYRSRAGEPLTGKQDYWPETAMSYYTSNPVGVASMNPAGVAGVVGGVIPDNNPQYAVATVRYLTMEPAITIIDCGDSHMSGYTQNTSLTYGANGLGGWPVKLRDYLILQSRMASLVRLSQTTDWSVNFHKRMERAIQARLGTHVLIPLGSINDTSATIEPGKNRLYQAQVRVQNLIQMAYENWLDPIVVIPWRTTDAVATQDHQVLRDAFMRAGVKVVDVPAIICQADRMTLLPQYVIPSDGSHYNEAAQTAIAMAALSIF